MLQKLRFLQLKNTVSKCRQLSKIIYVLKKNLKKKILNIILGFGVERFCDRLSRSKRDTTKC